MNHSTVYILDDEQALVDLHCEVADMVGFDARGFTRATQFFDQAKEFESGTVMVLDLQMPEMDGIEVMRRLAKMPNPPAMILISGHDIGVLHSAEKLCRAHGLEILASLSKPVSLQMLTQLLEQHIPVSNIAKQQHKPLAAEALSLDDLLHAIRREQLSLHFQPQIEIATGKLAGVEALVRWHHPELGLMNLEHFIPLAERHGVMGELTHWVIDHAVQQEQRWREAGFTASVSVNISATDITSLELPEQLAGLLQDNKLDPTRITLEVTESALMGELVTSLDILTRLRLKGFGLSIDDFGTGYSSLSQLHRVPFTELKIDRSFVSQMTKDEEARAIVKTCIMLGHELNMHIVAEGVETRAHFEVLQQLGCDVAQGYYIARPMPGDEVMSWAQKAGHLPLSVVMS